MMLLEIAEHLMETNRKLIEWASEVLEKNPPIEGNQKWKLYSVVIDKDGDFVAKWRTYIGCGEHEYHTNYHNIRSLQSMQ